MTVVADSTPLISLSALGKPDLLHRFYGRILIPEAVFREIVTQGQGRWGAAEIANASWIDMRTVPNSIALQTLPQKLGSHAHL